MIYWWHDFNRTPTTNWNTHFYGTRVTDQHWPKVQQMLRKSCENIVLIASRLQIEYGGNKGRNIVCSYDVFVYRNTLKKLYIYWGNITFSDWTNYNPIIHYKCTRLEQHDLIECILTCVDDHFIDSPLW